jgi:hypothetical protein
VGLLSFQTLIWTQPPLLSGVTGSTLPTVATSGSRPGLPRPRSSRGPLILLVAMIVIVGALGGAFALSQIWHGAPVGANQFGFANVSMVVPGSMGCREVPHEVCFGLTAATTLTGLQLGDIHFRLTNQTDQDYRAPSVPIGANASVLVMKAPGASAGQYNWSSGAWITGSTWVMPTNLNVEFVFDTGLTDGAQVNGTVFWALLSSPGSGADGAPLWT